MALVKKYKDAPLQYTKFPCLGQLKYVYIELTEKDGS